jgi:hypothetical protein
MKTRYRSPTAKFAMVFACVAASAVTAGCTAPARKVADSDAPVEIRQGAVLQGPIIVRDSADLAVFKLLPGAAINTTASP